ncbi:MAG: NAD(P)H-quinone oxidoreductase [Ilumatobacteraceae bacterium]
MRAVIVRSPGGPEVLEVVDAERPVPGPDEIVVDVHHSALNRADLLQRIGGYADPRRRAGSTAPEILGMEYAGTVAALGERVVEWTVGDAVMGIESGGCYAEQVATNARQAMPVPDGLALADAAAVPEVFLTAWDALVVQGGLTSGRWALVHAGASGVGTAAIQIVRVIGAHVAATCSPGKVAACRALGADVVLERSPADWTAALGEALAEHGRTDGVDVVLDVVGGEEADRNLRAVRSKGSIVQVGLLGGGRSSVNVGLLMAKRARWIGTMLRSRPPEEKLAISQRFVEEVVPLFARGALRPVIDRRFALADVADAHRYMETNANIGKILLDVR